MHWIGAGGWLCKDLWGSNPNKFHTVSQSLPTHRKSLTPTGLLIQQDLWENSCIVHSSLASCFEILMSCNHCKMKKYFALYICIVWKYLFMVYRLEFHCRLLLVMMQSHKCLNIKGWWPFFEWPSFSHLLRGWLWISVRAKRKRTFNKALWDTPLWLATALLAVPNIIIYQHDSGVLGREQADVSGKLTMFGLRVNMCAHVWEALLSLRTLDGCSKPGSLNSQ